MVLSGLNISESKKVSDVRRALPQILALLAKNLLVICLGLSLGFTTIMIPSLQGEGDPNETIILDKEGISWIGSLNFLLVPIGCIISGPITTKFGRRRLLQLLNIPFIAAWLLLYFSTKAWHIFLAIGVNGMALGLLEAPVMTYAAEICEPKLRGALTYTAFVSGNIGQFTSFLLGSLLPWRTVILIGIVFPVTGFIALFFVPESPYWLVSKNRLANAKKSLAWLRGWVSIEDIQEEFTQLQDHIEKDPFSQTINLKVLKSYFKPTFLKPFLMVSFGFVLCHLGSTPMVTYAIPTFKFWQAPIDAYNATVFLGLAPLISASISTLTVKFLGRRILTFMSLGGETVCVIILACYSFAIGGNYFDSSMELSSDVVEKYNFLPLVGMIGHSFFAILMVRALPWLLLAELFPNDFRTSACGICSAIAYLIGFVANKVYYNLIGVLTLGGVFVFFAGITISGFIGMYIYLPETEGKTLSETSGHYSGRGKLDTRSKK